MEEVLLMKCLRQSHHSSVCNMNCVPVTPRTPNEAAQRKTDGGVRNGVERIYILIYIYIEVYIFVCVCVCTRLDMYVYIEREAGGGEKTTWLPWRRQHPVGWEL